MADDESAKLNENHQSTKRYWYAGTRAIDTSYGHLDAVGGVKNKYMEMALLNPYEAANQFAADFRNTEYALKRSGIVRKNKKVAEADWDLFAKKLGPDFFNHVVKLGIAKTLIGHPPRLLLANMKWSPPNPAPLADVAQLVINGVCRVRNSYIHGEKFTGGPEGQWERDLTLISEAHAVLREAIRIFAQPNEE